MGVSARSVVIASLGALLLGACGPIGSARNADPVSSVSQRRSAGLAAIARPGTLLSLACQETLDGPDRVVVRGLSMDTGKLVSREVLISEPAGIGGLALGCGSVAASRVLFDQDFTRLAVTIADPSSGGSRVGYLDIETGKIVDLSPRHGGDYAAVPRDACPVFASSGDLWLAAQGRAYSVNPATGQRRDRGAIGSDQILPLPGDRVLADDHVIETVVNPAGTALAWYGDLATSSVAPIDVRGQAGRSKVILDLPGVPRLPGPTRPTVRPAAWVDDHTLIVQYDRNYRLVTFAADFKAVTAVGEEILPPSDWSAGNIVVAPDRKTIAFTTGRGTSHALFRLRLAPGAQPEKVTDLASPMTFVLWL